MFSFFVYGLKFSESDGMALQRLPGRPVGNKSELNLTNVEILDRESISGNHIRYLNRYKFKKYFVKCKLD